MKKFPFFMAKRYAFFLFSGKKAEIPRILEQNCRNFPNCGAKRQKFPICWGKNRNSPYLGQNSEIPLILEQNSRNFPYFGAKLQKFHLFQSNKSEIFLILGQKRQKFPLFCEKKAEIPLI